MKQIFDLNTYMKSQNLRWGKFPHTWDEGAFLGNGRLGACIYFQKGSHDMLLRIGANDVFDNRRAADDADYSKNMMYYTPRLPLGGFEFDFPAIPIKFDMENDLLTASLTGKIGRGFSFESYVPYGLDVIILKFSGTADISFQPEAAQSPRQTKMLRERDKNRVLADYEPPKPAYSEQENGIFYHIQPLFDGGCYVIAYKICSAGEESQLTVSVAVNSDTVTAKAQAAGDIEYALSNADSVRAKHESFWREYFSKGLISLPDKRMESFYYIQMYKLACAMRRGGVVYDTIGPWLTGDTAWPGAWWNLNVELTVSPLYTSNHLETAENLCMELLRHFDELIANVPEEYRFDSAAIGRASTGSYKSPVKMCQEDASPGELEIGNLTWVLFYCYKQYLYSNDRSIIDRLVYPLLQRSICFYQHFLHDSDDGRLHLPVTCSPEYPDLSADCNYSLALLRWGLKTLETLSRDMGETDKCEVWNKCNQLLADYPFDENEGYMIGADVHLSESHRHFSHLLMIYPLCLVTPDTGENREKIIKSLNFWQSMPEALQGYSHTGAASMYALLHDGDSALWHLNELMSGFVTPNTMYKEGGSPVLETPPSAAESILNMLLMSVNGVIDVFPAVPTEWHNVSFRELKAEGGFDISADYKNGFVQVIKIKSTFGTKAVFRADFENPDAVQGTASDVINLGGGLYEVELSPGAETEISDCGKYFIFNPDAEEYQRFGKN